MRDDHTEGVPAAEISAAFDRLVGVFGESPKQRRDGWVWALSGHLADWSSFELRAAVRDAAAECRFFPRPADILARRPKSAGAVAPAVASTMDHCLTCGSHLFYAGYAAAHGVFPRLRCACPPVGDGWNHPDALAWREDDEKLVAAGYTASTARVRAA